MNQTTTTVPSITAKDRVLNVLSADPNLVVSGQHEEWENLTGRQTPQVVLVGAGILARMILATKLRIQIRAIADNNRSVQGTELGGYTITSSEQAIQDYGIDACFVVTIHNGGEPIAKLRAAGCKQVIPFPIFFRHYSEEMLPHASAQLPFPLFDEANEVLLAFDMLEDEASRDEFASQIEYFGCPDYRFLKRISDTSEIYFDRDIFIQQSDERFVDCGAFDGDVIRVLLSRIPDFEGAIVAFEPDKSNVGALASYAAGLPEDLRHRISVQPFAVGNVNEKRSFTEDSSMASAFSESVGTEVQVVRLDEALADFAPSLIKMDVEGAELEALEGGWNTIAANQPVLAICSYHHLTHLWRIPLLIKSICPEYHFYLRRYADDCWETVIYAVPTRRMVDATCLTA